MKGLKIDFGTDGPSLRLSESVEGFRATVQNGLVHMGTITGSDPVFPTRGTDLLLSAVSGAVTKLSSARHVSNFAALDTRTFLAANEDPLETETLSDLKLLPASLTYLSLSVEAKFTSSAGTVIGITTNLPTTNAVS